MLWRQLEIIVIIIIIIIIIIMQRSGEKGKGVILHWRVGGVLTPFLEPLACRWDPDIGGSGSKVLTRLDQNC